MLETLWCVRQNPLQQCERLTASDHNCLIGVFAAEFQFSGLEKKTKGTNVCFFLSKLIEF